MLTHRQPLLRDGDSACWSQALDLFIKSTSGLVEAHEERFVQTGRREFSMGVTDFHGQRIFPDGSVLIGAFESERGRFKAGIKAGRVDQWSPHSTFMDSFQATAHQGRQVESTTLVRLDRRYLHPDHHVVPHYTELNEGEGREAERIALIQHIDQAVRVANVECCPRSRGATVYADARSMLLDGLREVVCGAPFVQLEGTPGVKRDNKAWLRIDVIGHQLRKTVS